MFLPKQVEVDEFELAFILKQVHKQAKILFLLFHLLVLLIDGFLSGEGNLLLFYFDCLLLTLILDD